MAACTKVLSVLTSKRVENYSLRGGASEGLCEIFASTTGTVTTQTSINLCVHVKYADLTLFMSCWYAKVKFISVYVVNRGF